MKHIKSQKDFLKKFLKESVSYHTQDEGDEHDIQKVDRDNQHEYQYCDGVLYELGYNDNDTIAYITEIEHTEGNSFYEDQVERYVKYIQNGGVLESFPVTEYPLGGAKTLEKMCEYLSDGDNFDLMWDLVNVKDNKAHFSLYDIIETLSYDSESVGIEESVLSSIRNLDDLNKFYGKNYIKQFDAEEIEDYGYYWEEEYYNSFKKILEHWDDNKEYTLTDMNHRFEAVKRLGKERVIVEIV